MQNSVLMRVLHCARYLDRKPDAFARCTAQGRGSILQAASRSILHAEERQSVFALAHFIDGKNIWMVETGRGFCFTPETFQRVLRISVIRYHPLECDDPA